MGGAVPYNTINNYLKERFGRRVFKVSVDGGFTCPNRDGTLGDKGCIYCLPATLLPRDHRPGAGVTEQLNSGIDRVKSRHGARGFIAYFQANTNTYSSIEKLSALYEEAAGHPEVVGLAVSTRPDCVDDEVIKLLSDINARKPLWLELGLQSAKDETLRLIGRGHSVEDFIRAAQRAVDAGIPVCAHVILGLPGEKREDMLRTMALLNDLSIWGVKFHQLQVIKGTPLEAMYERGLVKVLDLEQYVCLVVECLERLSPAMVIHRLVGEVPRSFLRAPRWPGNKFTVINRINNLMKERGTRQGARYSPKQSTATPRPF